MWLQGRWKIVFSLVVMWDVENSALQWTVCLCVLRLQGKLGWGSQCFMSPTHISSYKPLCDEQEVSMTAGMEEMNCGVLYKPHPLWHLSGATVTPEWGHCALHKLLFSSNWFHVFIYCLILNKKNKTRFCPVFIIVIVTLSLYNNHH